MGDLMLGRLLESLRRGGTESLSGLARELGVSEALLERMLEDLARRGYLTQLNNGCPGQCARCAAASLCSSGRPTRAWALTGKGSGMIAGRTCWKAGRIVT
jgi:predicted ArsR family transcriptional regulator